MQIPSPKPLDTWAEGLWDNSTTRNSALSFGKGFMVQMTARASGGQFWEALFAQTGLLPMRTNHGTGRHIVVLGTAVTW